MSDDLIRRSDAKQAIYELLLYLGEEDINTVVETVMKDIPSADRPQGEWIVEIDVNGYTYGRCSICNMRQYAGQLNFCPDCGAKMKRSRR